MRTRGTPAASWFVAYTALALVVTFPLVLHLSSVVPHDLGDPLLSATILWWNAHVLPLTERWWNGFAFFPAHGTVAFSDHRLGASLIATPLQWLGFDAVTAYNLIWLASFPLCAIAAHALAYVLTKRHDASALCGLAYGFNPYRVAHLEHLELLMAFGMPAALAALHMYAATRRARWMGAFALAVIVQGLSTSYYFLFFSVLLVLWILWFVRWPDWRLFLTIAGTFALAAVVLSPIALGYWRIHQIYGFHRSMGELLAFSADVTSLVTASPLSTLWGWTASLNASERQLFPGATITVVALSGAVAAALGVRREPRDRRDWLSTGLVLAALAFGAAALAVALHQAPWRLTWGVISVSATTAFKPLSLALAAVIAAVAVSSPSRAAFRRRSPLAFYLMASGVLFLCSFGPKPTFLGTQILYEPPYAWLMRLPLFGDGVRVPARFAMPAVLCLAVSGALAFGRLRLSGSLRTVMAATLMAGIAADGWISRMPLPEVPAMWTASRANGFDAVLELPLVAGLNDFAAMYHVTRHALRTVNGNSGYRPPHYIAFESALLDGDDTALAAIAQHGTVLVVVDKRLDGDGDGRWDRLVRASPYATPLSTDERWTFFSIRQGPRSPRCEGVTLPVTAVSDRLGKVDLATLTDRNPMTAWATPSPQQRGDTLTLELGAPARLCSVRLSLGEAAGAYPRLVSVSTSLDGNTWHSTFTGRTGGLAVRAALDDPRDVWLELPAAAESARYVRLRLEASHPQAPWSASELAVIGTPLAR